MYMILSFAKLRISPVDLFRMPFIGSMSPNPLNETNNPLPKRLRVVLFHASILWKDA